MNPAVICSNNTLGAENDAVGMLVFKRFKDRVDFINSVFFDSFKADGGEYFVCIMVMMTAAALFAMLVMVMMLVIMAVALFAVLVVVMMLVIMAAALFTVFVVVMLMVVAVALFAVFVMMMLMVVAVTFFAVLVVMMLMIVAMALFAVLVMMMLMIVAVALFAVLMVMVGFVLLLFKFFGKKLGSFHGVENLLAVKRIPRSCNDVCFVIKSADKLYCFCKFFFSCILRTAEDNCACIFYLIAEEFAEILEVHLALLGINNGRKAVECNIVALKLFNSANNIAEFANAGRLDNNSVRSKFVKHLGE